ncbi:MAG: heavy metal translocating P-type ATPase [Desulfobacterales bacterium]|nr:MAG: heavy metal translocating P-type ATPase [Desulfobacterales bacterium]
MSLTGVSEASVDLTEHQARIHYDSAIVSSSDLKMAVEAQDYTVLEAAANKTELTENCCIQLIKWPSKSRSYLYGAIAAVAIVGIYLGMNTLTADWYFARMQFGEYRWWIIALAIGLGVQVTLFTTFRARLRDTKMRAAKSSMAATGGVSTAAMMACCSHYLAAVLPTLGVSFLSASAVASLEKYQAYFFLAGVLSSLFGIGLMSRLMKKHGMLHIGTLKGFISLLQRRINTPGRYGNDDVKAF